MQIKKKRTIPFLSETIIFIESAPACSFNQGWEELIEFADAVHPAWKINFSLVRHHCRDDFLSNLIRIKHPSLDAFDIIPSFIGRLKKSV